MGLFGRKRVEKKKKTVEKKNIEVVIGNSSNADPDTIVFPSDRELFPALFQEDSLRSFQSRYSMELMIAPNMGLFDFPENVERHLTEYREKGKITESELHSFLAPYKDSVRSLWLSLEEQLKTEIEQGTIDSFPMQYYPFQTFSWGDKLYKVEFRYFDELECANDRGISKWPWFSICEPIWLDGAKQNEQDILRVMQQAYRLLRYYTLWDSTLPVHQNEVSTMQDRFCRAMKSLGVNDCSFVYDVPELPEDLMAASEPLMPHDPVEKTPPEQFAELKDWDILRFGSYPYEKDGSRRTIEWEVLWSLPNKGDRFVVVASSLCLDVMPFNNERRDDVTWENSDLRRWLNEDFFNTAFTEEERRYIANKEITYGIDWDAMKPLRTHNHIYVPNEGVATRFREKMITPTARLTPYAFSKMKSLNLLGKVNRYTFESGFWMHNTDGNGEAKILTCTGISSQEPVNRSRPVRVMLQLMFDPAPEQ